MEESVILDPLDVMARSVALVPKARVNLIRYHGVLAPNTEVLLLIPCHSWCSEACKYPERMVSRWNRKLRR